MYPNHLGRFNIPANDPEWAGNMTYTPEPPIAVRGYMNPWEEERKREAWLAEEQAWKAIVPKQATFWQYSRQMKSLMNQYNALVAELENLTGQPVGLQKMTSFTQKIPFVGGMVGGIMGMIDSILGMLTGGLFGGGAKKKKKKAEELVRRIEAVQAQMSRVQDKLIAVVTEIETLVNTAQGIRASQPERAQAAIDQSVSAYQQRQQLDRLRADVLRERNRQVALMPRSPGGSNDL